MSRPDHDHRHSPLAAAQQPGPARDRRSANRARLAFTLALTATTMVAEIAGGYWSNSLALLADAGHMFSDVAALGLSWLAIWVAQRPPTPQHSYGFFRAEILAALANGAALVAISLLIVAEALARFSQPPQVAGPLMAGVALIGLLVNLAGLAILQGGKHDNLNMHGAWLHVFTDALGSVAALSGAALIWAFDWRWADPTASIAIALLVVYSAWHLIAESVAILMESAPKHVDIDALRDSLRATTGVLDVHDLHVWTISSGLVSLSAHVVLAEGHAHSVALEAIGRTALERFGIGHVTIQIEPDGRRECNSRFCR